MRKELLILTFLGLGGWGVADASTYFVAETGSDSNSGTGLSPWRTIQYAVENVPTGNVICVIPGVDPYAEKVVITRSGITVRGGNCGGVTGEAIVDPTTVTAGVTYHAAFEVRDASDITIGNFTISNAKNGVANTAGPYNVGVLVRTTSTGGPMSGITIEHNHFTGVKSPALGISRGGFGIWVIGNRLGVNYAISEVEIVGNDFYDNALSADWNSNAILLMGNVTDSLVADNLLSNFAAPGPNPTPGLKGTIGIQTADNQASSDATNHARRIVITGNTIVQDRDSGAYSSSWGDVLALAFIGTQQILVERNYVRNAYQAINVSAENPDDDTGQIWVRDNVIHNSIKFDLSVGDPTFQPPSGETHTDCYRPVEDVFVTSNTFYADTVSSSAQYRIILRPGILGESAFRNNIVSSQYQLLLFDEFGAPTPNSSEGCGALTPPSFPNDTDVDYNVWNSRPSPDVIKAFNYMDTFADGPSYYLNWAAYRTAASPFDASSFNTDPLLDDPTISTGYAIDALSDAVDSGDHLAPTWGDTVGDFGTYDVAEVDFYGNTRVVGSDVDMGAAEYQP